jgi:hypothetical protein
VAPDSWHDFKPRLFNTPISTRQGATDQKRQFRMVKSFSPHPTWKNMPMIAIMFASSALSFLVFSAGSDAVNTLNPKSPAYASVPGVWSWETSQKAM